MSWGTSLLAMLVGVLGVMNTMLMTVFERTQEICVLLALGWKRGRIMRMILWESALLGLFGGIVGVLLGAVGVKILGRAPPIRGLLEPDVSLELLGDVGRHRDGRRRSQRPVPGVAQFPPEPGPRTPRRIAVPVTGHGVKHSNGTSFPSSIVYPLSFILPHIPPP